MTQEEFWLFIERTRPAGAYELKLHAQNVILLLSQMPLEEIESYARHFNEAMGKVSSWEHWKAACTIYRYFSDDCFANFRAGLVAQGRNVVESVAVNPDRLAVLPADLLRQLPSPAGEALFFAATTAYQTKMFGTVDMDFEDYPEVLEDYPPMELGDEGELEFAHLSQRFPELSRLYQEHRLEIS